MLGIKKGSPLVMAHAGGLAHGRENSVAAIRKALLYKPDIVEVDVRKSRDGVLYCYHGFPKVPVYLLAFFLKFISFVKIKKYLKVDLLDSILKEIGDKAVIFLDIKDQRVSPKNIQDALKTHKGKVWIASSSLKYLGEMKSVIESKVSYVYNFSFLDFTSGLKKASRAGVDALKLLPSQCTKENIVKMQQQGIRHVIHPVLISRKKYKKLVKDFGSLWIALDDMNRPDAWLMGI